MSAQQTMATAKQHLAGGNINEAVRLCQTVLAETPNHFDALFMLGAVLLHVKDYPQALNFLQMAHQANPEDGECNQNLANAYMLTGQPQRAVPCFDVALAKMPSNAMLHFSAGMAYQQVYDTEKAREQFKKTLELEPKMAVAHIKLGKLANYEGKLEEALDHINKGLKIDPKFAEGMIDKAHILERLNRLKEARKAIAPLEATQKNNRDVLLCLAKLEQRGKNYARALEYYEKAIPQCTNQAGRGAAMNEAAKVLDKLERYDEAFARFAEAQQLIAQSPEAQIADKTVRQGLTERYKQWLEQADVGAWEQLESDPEHPAPIFIVGFPRSGTTLVEQMLSSHPVLHGSQEKPIIDDLINNIPQVIGRQIDYPAGLEELSQEEWTKLRARYWDIYKDYFSDEPKEGFIDKLPLNITHLGFIHRIFPDAAIIVPIRDPRDTILSCFMQVFKPNSAMANFYNIEDAVKFYAQTMDFYALAKKKLSLRLLEYKYEDLVADTEVHVRQLIDFVGESWDSDVLRYHEEDKATAIVTPSYEAVAQPVYTTAVARWRHYEAQIAPILPILAPYMEKWGYGER